MTIRATITGRVQGVAFRAWARDEARALGLAGWVRNERDGSVSALLQGPGERVDDMLARLNEGPPLARVEDVRTRDEPGAPEARGFEILR